MLYIEPTWIVGVLTIIPEREDGLAIRDERKCSPIARAAAQDPRVLIAAWTRGRVELVLSLPEAEPVEGALSAIMDGPLGDITAEHSPCWSMTLVTDPAAWDFATAPVEAAARAALADAGIHQCDDPSTCLCGRRGTTYEDAWSRSMHRGIEMGLTMREEVLA